MKLLRNERTKEFHSAISDEDFERLDIESVEGSEDLEVVDVNVNVMGFSNAMVAGADAHNVGALVVHDEADAPAHEPAADDFESYVPGLVLRGKKRHKPKR